MNRFTRSLCIVGAMLAIVFALAAPSFACDTLGVISAPRAYQSTSAVLAPVPVAYPLFQPQAVYAAPIVEQSCHPAVVERVVVKQPAVQVQKIVQVQAPVVAHPVVLEKVRFAPSKQRIVNVQRIERAPVRREVVRSRSVQSVRVR